MNPENRQGETQHVSLDIPIVIIFCFLCYILSNSTTYILSNFIRFPPPALKPSNPRGSTPKVN